MSSHEELERRKAIKASLRSAEIERIRQSLPLEPAQMKSLFDFVGEELEEAGCDHTLRHTLSFLERLQVGSEPVVAWLEDAGGYCDCEVLANAMERFELAFPPDK
jgi:hypothetical protein